MRQNTDREVADRIKAAKNPGKGRLIDAAQYESVRRPLLIESTAGKQVFGSDVARNKKLVEELRGEADTV